MAIDPVCGMEVDERNASGKSERDGKTYYFCSQECQEEFEDNPEIFLEDLADFEDEGDERKTA